MPHYGNWCGPGWSAGKAKDAGDLTFKDFKVKAVDDLDKECKNHDIDIRMASSYEELVKADKKFIGAAKSHGGPGYVFAELVEKFGPSKIDPKDFKPYAPIDSLSLFKKRKEEQERLALNRLRKKQLAKMSAGAEREEEIRRKEAMENKRKYDRVKHEQEELDTDNRRKEPKTLSTSAFKKGPAAASGLGDETKVDPVRMVKLLPFAETQNVVMPFRHQISWTHDGTANAQKHFGFRLNSIVDVLSDWTYTVDAVQTAGDTQVGNNNTPMLYKYWSSIYRYYTVTACEYKIKIWMPNCADNRTEFSVWRYHHGFQTPPLLTTGSANIIPDKYRRAHRHANWRAIRPNPNEGKNLDSTPTTDKHWIAVNHDKDNMITMEGMYRPGEHYVESEVDEDAYVQAWNKIGAINPQRQGCTVIVNLSDDSHRYATALNAVNQFNFTAVMEIVYHVQLKDLKSAYQYPTAGDDVAAVTGYMAMQESV